MSEIRNKRPENIRPKMSNADRAKQFAPFAALGHTDHLLRAVEESRDVGDFEHIAFLDDLSQEEIAAMTAEDKMDMFSEDEQR